MDGGREKVGKKDLGMSVGLTVFPRIHEKPKRPDAASSMTPTSEDSEPLAPHSRQRVCTADCRRPEITSARNGRSKGGCAQQTNLIRTAIPTAVRSSIYLQ
jgi:hypothetical protein